ncbi:helix-turn-helix domain-containing protein [Salinarimonas soli]|nr:AraC family transcriptional regulator [Salinarimonas soli]
MYLSAHALNDHARSASRMASRLAARHPDGIDETWIAPTCPNYVGARSVTLDHDAWSDAAVTLAHVRASGEVHASLTADCTRILVAVEEVGGPFVLRGEAALGRPLALAPNGVSVVPAGAEVSGSARRLSYLCHLAVQVDRDHLEAAFGDTLDIGRVLAPRLMSTNPRAAGLARMIADECNGVQTHDRVFRDSLMLAFLSALVSGVDQASKPARGGLAAWQVRRTIDYIVQNLGSDIDLAQLAGGVGLSRSHFCRAFRETTGLPPHKWVINARIERAKEHLLAAKLSLSQIALDVGFSDQSHFTRAFSKSEGISPGAWLRSRL